MLPLIVSGSSAASSTSFSAITSGTNANTLTVTGNTFTVGTAGAASAPAISITGAPFTGGSGTTTLPLVYINNGTAPTSFSTNGTELGINAPSGFSGNFLDCHINGGNSLFSVNFLGRAYCTSEFGISGGVYLDTATAANPPNNSLQIGSFTGINLTDVYMGVGALSATQISAVPMNTPVFVSSSTASTGGTLTGSTTYYYQVALTDCWGFTTPACPEFSVTTAAGTDTNTITFYFTSNPSAAQWKIYGRTTGAEQLIATVVNTNAGTGKYTDTGSGSPSGAVPTTNTTGNLIFGATSEVNVIQLATPVNGTFTTASFGGSLAAGTTYYYRVSAFDTVGTSLASPETSITTSGAGGSAHTVTVVWNPVPGAMGYNIYGRTTGAEQLIGTVYYVGGPLFQTYSFVDTGAVTPSGALPTANTTGNINLATSQNTYTGSVSGTAVWSMPFQGSSYKKFLITFLALHDAGGTITFPTEFAHTPTVYGDSAVTAVSSATTTTFTIAAAATLSGNVFCEGY